MGYVPSTTLILRARHKKTSVLRDDVTLVGSEAFATQVPSSPMTSLYKAPIRAATKTNLQYNGVYKRY